MNNISTVKLIITLIDVDSDRLEEETIKLLKHMKQLKLLNVIEKVKRILEPESNSSEQNKAGGGYLPGKLEVEFEGGEEQISRVIRSVDEKTNGKHKVQCFRRDGTLIYQYEKINGKSKEQCFRRDGTLIYQTERQNCSDEEFYALIDKIQNMM